MKRKTKLKKGDTAIVIAGKEKGKKGKILHIDLKKSRVVLESVNLRKKFVRPSQDSPKGGLINIESPMHISNVNYYDDKEKRGFRVGITGDGKYKSRVIRLKSGSQKKID